MDYKGQPVVTAQDAGVIPLPVEVNHVVGTANTILMRPTAAKLLTLICEVDAFRVKVGSSAGLTGSAPASTTSDGSGSVKLVAGQKLTIPAPTSVTVVGTGASSVLTYYWS